MKIIFNDLLQEGVAPEQLKSAALADKYHYTQPVRIIFNGNSKIN